MIPIAVTIPLLEQLLQIAAKLLEHSEAEGAVEEARRTELQERLNIAAAAVGGYWTGGLNRGTTSQGGMGELTHVRPAEPQEQPR